MRARSHPRLCEYLFWTVGIVAIGYCAAALLYAHVDQTYLSWRFDQARKTATHLDEGSPVGRLGIPRIHFSVMILEGIGGGTLRRAVGHIPGTALPGQPGNVGIAGHRDTFFRSLRSIHKNDEIVLTTLDGSYRYRVESLQVIAPNDMGVLEDVGQPVLTLVTCYPFSFVGSAPSRFIVRARALAGQRFGSERPRKNFEREGERKRLAILLFFPYRFTRVVFAQNHPA